MKQRRFRKIIVSVLIGATVLASIMLGLFYTKLIWLRPVDIEYLYKHIQTDKALAGAIVQIESAKVETNLREDYKKSSLNESTKITEKDKLAVINKWSNELYPYFGNFMLAAAMDSLTFKTAEGIKANSTSSEKIVNSISTWALNRLSHTQTIDIFKNLPGRDPWGAINIIQPTYKKVLPSEMLAKSIYTGKITGKCCSLAALNTGIFAVIGSEPEDIIILRYNSHNIGIVKYNDKLFILNNQRIDPINEKIKDFLMKQKYKGFFNYSMSILSNFKLNEEFFSTDRTLLEAVVKLTGTTEQLQKDKMLNIDVMQSKEKLFDLIFREESNEENLKKISLTRYAYQSLYVKNPELYLKASVRAPIVKDLAKKLSSEGQIVSWIKNNISYSSIFEDYNERLMLADQVIVFKKGGAKDQALLACSLLRIKGFNPLLKITGETAYVEVNNRLYDAKTWGIVNSVEGEVEIELKLN